MVTGYPPLTGLTVILQRGLRRIERAYLGQDVTSAKALCTRNQ